MPSDSLNVDLADVQDIRDKLPQATKILKQKADIALDALDDYQTFRELVKYLAKRAGAEPPRDQLAGAVAPTSDDTAPTPEPSGATVVDLVVGVVNRAAREVRPRDVRDILQREGHTFESADAVSNALNYAARRELVKFVKRGWYAPLGYETGNRDDLLSGTQSGGP
jgi:hypothetical protein